METDPIATNPAPAATAAPQPSPPHSAPKGGRLKRAAQIVSDVFSPLLAPTYCMAMAMWITPLQILPESTRMGATLGVAIITGAIPLCLLLLLFHTGRIADMCISRRSERTVPMIIAVLAYIGAAVYLGILHAPMWLRCFFYGAAASTVIALFVNLRWKISAHAIAIGGMAGMMLWLTATGLATVNAMIWLTGAIILGGIVGSARLVLERHTPAQVMTGWLLGAVCVFISMCMI
ncbi:MAG: phosphatase PAP2 family protein [Muribaculaceae bacterium]|nr:phosphatase PAP2 family protein [Muribaculaceae bacterium]MDE6487531.1 phosphatase PAP2 family protein [Muribaculaceae bacterium]